MRALKPESKYEIPCGYVWYRDDGQIANFVLHVRTIMALCIIGSRERAIMGLQSQAISVQVTKLTTTILVKHVISNRYTIGCPHVRVDNSRVLWRVIYLMYM